MVGDKGDARRARLLLVDDDRAMLEYMTRMTRDAGYEPVCASTWTDALRIFREDKPDLVLLDVMMPTVDGYKLARMLKTEAPSFVPVILLTALDDLESKRRGMAAGADDFLSKPVMPLELSIRLSSMLRIKDLTDELAAANSKLAELATTDPLTGLYNRRALGTQLEREFQRAKRYGRPLSVIMVDVDHFKQVNDTHGHPVGDRVLQLVAEVLRSSIRNVDFAARIGGEEFMVLAPETGHATVGVLAERIRTRVASASAQGGEGIPAVTISLGLITSELAAAQSPEEMIRLADEALYQAKRSGRNRSVFAG